MSANVKNNLNFVFCPPLPGKPDPNWDPASGEPRGRVVQNRQKGDTSSFYSLQILRNEARIGKHPLESQQEMRKVEKYFSEHRKTVTYINEKFDGWIDFAMKVTKEFKRPVTKEIAKTLLEMTSPIVPEEHRQSTTEALLFFQQQDEYNDFSTCLAEVSLKALIAAHREYLDKCDVAIYPLKASHEQFIAEMGAIAGRVSERKTDNYIEDLIPKFNREWDLIDKATLMEAAAFKKAYKAYGAKLSTWAPDQPIENLIEELHVHGPLLVRGTIGRASYLAASTKLPEEIEGRTLFGWEPNTPRIDVRSGMRHTIVIIGAKIDGEKRFVYFVDPMDGSSPKAQNIYMSSYEHLMESITDLNGMLTLNKLGENMVIRSADGASNHALYYPKS